MSSHQSRAQINSPPPPYSEEDPAKQVERRRSESRGRKATVENGQGFGVQVFVAQMHYRCMKPVKDNRNDEQNK